ncbi:hypothetical protein, partial [Rhizorhabdus wittichii]
MAALVIAAKGDTSLSSHLLVAAASGALIGLGSRLWMVTLGVAMLAWLATHLATSGPALWLVAVTLVLGAIPRPRPLPRLPGPVLAAAPVLIALALLLVAQGLAGWPASLLALACVA